MLEQHTDSIGGKASNNEIMSTRNTITHTYSCWVLDKGENLAGTLLASVVVSEVRADKQSMQLLS